MKRWLCGLLMVCCLLAAGCAKTNDPTAASAPASPYKPGDTVFYGHYEQDGDDTNGAESIEWIVLASDADAVTLISRYALDASAKNDADAYGGLRGWLNDDFLNAAFTAEEKAKLAGVTLNGEENAVYSGDAGALDRVFLLSAAEVKRYFVSDELRRCDPTPYAREQGAYTESGVDSCWWWLRTPGSREGDYTCVYPDGSLKDMLEQVDPDDCGVRPAIALKP